MFSLTGSVNDSLACAGFLPMRHSESTTPLGCSQRRSHEVRPGVTVAAGGVNEVWVPIPGSAVAAVWRPGPGPTTLPLQFVRSAASSATPSLYSSPEATCATSIAR